MDEELKKKPDESVEDYHRRLHTRMDGYADQLVALFKSWGPPALIAGVLYEVVCTNPELAEAYNRIALVRLMNPPSPPCQCPKCVADRAPKAKA